jgi:pyruvate dehydrogenase E2 component (dihydrolipoamide acetyltransferase)
VLVPDIGDFDEVAVIEVFVKAGDAVKVEQSLITVESDKASMEIPVVARRPGDRDARQGGRQGQEGLAHRDADGLQRPRLQPLRLHRLPQPQAAAPAASDALAPAARGHTPQPLRLRPLPAPRTCGGAGPAAACVAVHPPPGAGTGRSAGAKCKGSGPKGRITPARPAGLRQVA